MGGCVSLQTMAVVMIVMVLRIHHPAHKIGSSILTRVENIQGHCTATF